MRAARRALCIAFVSLSFACADRRTMDQDIHTDTFAGESKAAPVGKTEVSPTRPLQPGTTRVTTTVVNEAANGATAAPPRP
jgi:hypothetical protein